MSSRNMLPKVMLTLRTANQSLSFFLLNVLLAMLDKDVAEINYKDVQELLVHPKEFKTRLHIPVFRNLFFGPKKPIPARIPEDLFFFLCFPEAFFTGMWFLEGVSGIPVFCCFRRIFL